MGQINFDGKLLADLGGFGKVNRLAVVLIQEEENKILAICKTSDSTGTRTKPDKLKKILDDRSLADKIIAVGFDTASTNTGVHRIALTILQQLLSQQILWMAFCLFGAGFYTSQCLLKIYIIIIIVIIKINPRRARNM